MKEGSAMTQVYLVWYTPTNQTIEALWGVYANRKNAERTADFILLNHYGTNIKINEEEIMDAE
jgi:hypothetical protein